MHRATAQEFFKKLYDEGKFIEKETEQYFDPERQKFLSDRYIVGTCPKCGADGAYGDQCEKCGSSLSPDELINPHSQLSGAALVKKPTKHWYLPLDQYEGWLREWILEGHKEWKVNVYGQVKSWLDGTGLVENHLVVFQKFRVEGEGTLDVAHADDSAVGTARGLLLVDEDIVVLLKLKQVAVRILHEEMLLTCR